MHLGLLHSGLHLADQLQLLADEAPEALDLVVDALVDFLPAEVKEGVAVVVEDLGLRDAGDIV